jgi:hypothetical protein
MELTGGGCIHTSSIGGCPNPLRNRLRSDFIDEEEEEIFFVADLDEKFGGNLLQILY